MSPEQGGVMTTIMACAMMSFNYVSTHFILDKVSNLDVHVDTTQGIKVMPHIITSAGFGESGSVHSFTPKTVYGNQPSC
jgi:hypothetical protein